MTITTTVIVDDAEKTITRVVDDVKKSTAVTTVYKPGTPQFNAQALLDRASVALANNSTFLAIPSPTQPQALAQVQALTRQMNALIRFELNNFTDISDS